MKLLLRICDAQNIYLASYILSEQRTLTKLGAIGTLSCSTLTSADYVRTYIATLSQSKIHLGFNHTV